MGVNLFQYKTNRMVAYEKCGVYDARKEIIVIFAGRSLKNTEKAHESMKPAQIFRQYIWIINTLRAHHKMTLEELNQRWIEDGVADGNPLVRSSFNRHRDAILDMFGVIIDCEPKTYKYYIGNKEILNDDSIERWLFSTIAVHGVLADSAAVKERLVLENAPAGEQYLETILRAIKSNHHCCLLSSSTAWPQIFF